MEFIRTWTLRILFCLLSAASCQLTQALHLVPLFSGHIGPQARILHIVRVQITLCIPWRFPPWVEADFLLVDPPDGEGVLVKPQSLPRPLG